MKLSGAVEQACCIMALLADPKRTTPITNDALAEKMAVSPTYLRCWRWFRFGEGAEASDAARRCLGD